MKTNTNVGARPGIYATAEYGVAVCRNVKCEKCGQYYHYETRHEVVGRGRAIDDQTATARAERSAELKLMQAMAARVEIVPCAFCGWVQADMVHQMQKDVAPRYLAWAKLLTFYAVIYTGNPRGVEGGMVAKQGKAPRDHLGKRELPA